jgi:hypothetical protein
VNIVPVSTADEAHNFYELGEGRLVLQLFSEVFGRAGLSILKEVIRPCWVQGRDENYATRPVFHTLFHLLY